MCTFASLDSEWCVCWFSVVTGPFGHYFRWLSKTHFVIVSCWTVADYWQLGLFTFQVSCTESCVSNDGEFCLLLLFLLLQLIVFFFSVYNVRITFSDSLYYQVVNMSTRPRYEHCSLSKLNVAIVHVRSWVTFKVFGKEINGWKLLLQFVSHF